eukprot:CAMPEP_0176326342 /NCGR_PEP_ID=MMETSP0121_2-20121125/73878_1 /TAXON_ID=160619 /ORGANISM="Kryptoperidinium foliaceum, Strain CCMP 1326" /LENGTH=125 /DNA_ID=CAMNT_0017668939 /DNA_START=625 /DNA_END=999 /DNA_ORIENTATION=-
MADRMGRGRPPVEQPPAAAPQRRGELGSRPLPLAPGGEVHCGVAEVGALLRELPHRGAQARNIRRVPHVGRQEALVHQVEQRPLQRQHRVLVVWQDAKAPQEGPHDRLHLTPQGHVVVEVLLQEP